MFRGGIGRTLAMELKDGIVKHYNITDRGGMISPSVSAIWDKVQMDLHCCGVNSYEDWYNIENWPNQRWVSVLIFILDQFKTLLLNLRSPNPAADRATI